MNWKKKLIIFGLTTTVFCSSPVMSSAASGDWETWKNEWKTIKNDWTQVAISPGSDETQMNFAWYSYNDAEVSFRYGRKPDLSDAQSAEIVQTEAQEGYRSNKVILTGLKPDTTYYYQADQKKTESFHTNDAGDDFSFIFVGDPQIGKSSAIKAEKYGDVTEEFLLAQNEAVRKDAFVWNDTLNKAYQKSHRQADFILSAGDQIQRKAKKLKDTTLSEIEYSGYLSPDVMKSVPVATTVGTHDEDNPNYDYHFNVPNVSSLGANDYVSGDYWFTYGTALFMILNTQNSNTAEHKQFIEETIDKNPECTWRIVTLHQDIYGSAKHSDDKKMLELRYQLIPYFDENDIDVVFTGHDHSYTRSKFLKEDKVTDDVIVNGTVVNPEGILYMTGNSSSGSGYYTLLKEVQPYVAYRWQGEVPTYSLVDVTKDSFLIRTYRTDNGKLIDDALTILKNAKDKDIGKASVNTIRDMSYTGKKLTPEVTVRMNGIALKKGKDYSVSYDNNLNIGTAAVTITGLGDYSGKKIQTFSIVPSKVEIQSVKSTKKKIAVVKYKKSKEKVDGYQIVYSRDFKFRNFRETKTEKTTIRLKSLKKGKTYAVKVRSFKKISGKTYYGEFSDILKVKVKM